MKLVLFEDKNYTNLLPLVYFRPVWELRCGAVTLLEKFKLHLGEVDAFLGRTYLEDNYLPNDKLLRNHVNTGSVLLLNGRWVIASADAAILQNLQPGEGITSGTEILACCLDSKSLPDFYHESGMDTEKLLSAHTFSQHRAKVIRYPWDAVHWNGAEIEADFHQTANLDNHIEKIGNGIHLVDAEKIHIGKNVTIKPGVVIDAENGPVWIDDGAVIMANSVLEGPLYIGKNSKIKIAAKIYENTTIGPVCKVGGEVEGSIIQGYSNKQHDGFLGHAYLGSWVNLGADTNNSDLKNNYGMVKAFVNGEAVDTGSQFVGLMMGDHSKCSINTMFNTGTIVGTNCNIFGAGMPPKFVPSFSWGGADGFSEYRFDKASAVAKAVMVRRKIDFTENDANLFRHVQQLAKSIEKGSLVSG